MRHIAYVALLLVCPAAAQENNTQLLRYWDYDKSAPLNAKEVGVRKLDGVTVYDISFSAPVGDRSAAIGPDGGAVTAWWFLLEQGRFLR
jgi:hypothetical protein